MLLSHNPVFEDFYNPVFEDFWAQIIRNSLTINLLDSIKKSVNWEKMLKEQLDSNYQGFMTLMCSNFSPLISRWIH
jgi:hypothetical protein